MAWWPNQCKTSFPNLVMVLLHHLLCNEPLFVQNFHKTENLIIFFCVNVHLCIPSFQRLSIMFTHWVTTQTTRWHLNKLIFSRKLHSKVLMNRQRPILMLMMVPPLLCCCRLAPQPCKIMVEKINGCSAETDVYAPRFTPRDDVDLMTYKIPLVMRLCTAAYQWCCCIAVEDRH